MANTPFVNRNPDYADLDLDFVMNPSTGDINYSKKNKAATISQFNGRSKFVPS